MGLWQTGESTTTDLIEEKFAASAGTGYPACPDHTEKEFSGIAGRGAAHRHQAHGEFCHVARSSVADSTSRNPESKYFAVGKLGKDQLADLAQRKGKNSRRDGALAGTWLNYS